ncbi:MAG TPA: phosphomannomutase [Bryobacteraceae bacterium]|nr:phosphomannomutase [Bryobacteraceae bacterium]
MLSSLGENLVYRPRELRFGTSGRRGRVIDLTQLEIYINVLAELEYLQSLTLADGGIGRGGEFCFARDLRPSSAEICLAAEQAIRDAGMIPVNMGVIPTPALMYYALSRAIGSIMVTGSHIPFDLNGYKLNRSTGEMLKEHEAPIGESSDHVRASLYAQPFSESPFDEHGRFRDGYRELAPEHGVARLAYLDRYRKFFQGLSLSGYGILVYQHSAVGRDLLVEILESFGAEVVAAGRSDTFVAIDTEAIDAAQLAAIQALADRAGRLDAVVSTDGDSDRPLILGVESGRVQFFSGDLVGMVVAEYLGADAVVVPISCNDAIDRGALAPVLGPKTRIGSPHVVAGMAAACRKGGETVCGWEANGGFLLGSDIERNGRTLTALPTRDAFLPILTVLFAARAKRVSLAALFAELPKRYSRAALVRNFSRESGKRIVEILSARKPAQLEEFFTPASGFSVIAGVDLTDGLRIFFTNGDIAHFRPSGNADEFRVYAVADTQERADRIIEAGIAEPCGIVRAMERVLIA